MSRKNNPGSSSPFSSLKMLLSMLVDTFDEGNVRMCSFCYYSNFICVLLKCKGWHMENQLSNVRLWTRWLSAIFWIYVFI